MRSDSKSTTFRTAVVVGLALLAAIVGSAYLRAESGSVHTSEMFELGDGVDPAVPGIADILGSDQPGPDWNDLFNANRTPKDELDEAGNPGSNGVPDFLDTWGAYRGRRDVSFVADDISAGTSDDSSVFLDRRLIGSGIVDSGFDLGNAYAYSGFADLWNFVLYTGVERLASSSGSIVFEFNQKLFSLGSRGKIEGIRSVGDLRVEADFSTGILGSVVISSWELVDPQENLHGWLPVETLPISPEQPAEQCNPSGTVCAVCNGINVDGGDWPNFDASGNDIADLVPDTFVEIGINLTSLLGIHTWESYYSTRYTSLQISTFDAGLNPSPQDYVLGEFIRASRVARAASR